MFAEQCTESIENARDGGPGPYTDACVDELKSVVHDLKVICVEVGLGDTAIEIEDAESRIVYDLNVDALLEIVKRVESSIAKELRNFKAIAVSSDRSKYVDNMELFADLQSAFPSAIDDLIDAANCLAVECHTASVFHAMRAAEIGLRALARDRHVQIPKNRPIELATWEVIIKELEKAETEILDYPATLAREAQFGFYHGAMMEFRAFKNKFRNPAMHSRERFDRDEASSALTHVVEFLRALSAKIGEGKRTQKVWKSASLGGK